MEEFHWEPVASTDKDSSSLLKVIIMFVLTLFIGVLIWNI